MWKSKSGVGKNQLRPSAGKIRMLHLLVVGNEPVPISVWRGDRDSAIGSGDMPANRQTDRHIDTQEHRRAHYNTSPPLPRA